MDMFDDQDEFENSFEDRQDTVEVSVEKILQSIFDFCNDELSIGVNLQTWEVTVDEPSDEFSHELLSKLRDGLSWDRRRSAKVFITKRLQDLKILINMHTNERGYISEKIFAFKKWIYELLMRNFLIISLSDNDDMLFREIHGKKMIKIAIWEIIERELERILPETDSDE